MQGIGGYLRVGLVSVRRRKPGLRSFGTRVDLKKNKQNLLNIEVVPVREQLHRNRLNSVHEFI